VSAAANTVQVLEEITLVTPLGVRFRDESTLALIADDLVVNLHPDGLPELQTRGVMNRSGVFVFANLPGMSGVERGAGDEAFWAEQPPRFAFVLEVTDRAARFLPFAYSLQLPVRHLLAEPAGSLLEPADGLRLFSAPSRESAEAMAIVRAEIVDIVHHEPAAWALVEAKTEANFVRGLADARGRVMLALPYPRPQIVLGSLPGSGGPDLRQQVWNVDLTIRYARRDPVPDRPDLEDILTQPIATTTSAIVRFGQELQLAPISITPAGP
jgi:hypothetical protein